MIILMSYWIYQHTSYNSNKFNKNEKLIIKVTASQFVGYRTYKKILLPHFDISCVKNSQDPEKFIMSLYLYEKGQAYNHESWIHNVVILIRWQLYGSIHIRLIFHAYEKFNDFRLKCHLTELLKEIKRKMLMWSTWPKHRHCYETLKQQVFSCKSDIHLHSI